MSSISKALNFPNVSGSNLERHRLSLPMDFEGNLNIVIVAFRREQTTLIESWARSLEEIEKKNSSVRFYELPVLSRAYSPLRWWIDGGMRAGIIDKETRQRTITLYTTKSAFKNQLSIPNEETIYIFLINKAGKILWQTKESFTEEKIKELQLAIERNLDEKENV